MTRTRVRSGLSGDVLYAGDLTAEHSFLKNIPPDDDPRDPDYQPSVSGNSNDGGRGRASTINGVDLKARSAKKRKPAGKASNMSPEKRKRLQESSLPNQVTLHPTTSTEYLPNDGRESRHTSPGLSYDSTLGPSDTSVDARVQSHTAPMARTYSTPSSSMQPPPKPKRQSNTTQREGQKNLAIRKLLSLAPPEDSAEEPSSTVNHIDQTEISDATLRTSPTRNVTTHSELWTTVNSIYDNILNADSGQRPLEATDNFGVLPRSADADDDIPHPHFDDSASEYHDATTSLSFSQPLRATDQPSPSKDGNLKMVEDVDTAQWEPEQHQLHNGRDWREMSRTLGPELTPVPSRAVASPAAESLAKHDASTQTLSLVYSSSTAYQFRDGIPVCRELAERLKKLKLDRINLIAASAQESKQVQFIRDEVNNISIMKRQYEKPLASFEDAVSSNYRYARGNVARALAVQLSEARQKLDQLEQVVADRPLQLKALDDEIGKLQKEMLAGAQAYNECLQLLEPASADVEV